MPKPSMRDDLLEHGQRVLHERGYHATSVADIANAAGAPKGSFYNHFESKEAFAIEVLRAYFNAFGDSLDQTLGNAAIPPKQRFEQLIDSLVALFSSNGWTGCLLGNLALDASPTSEAIRTEVNSLFETWRRRLRDSFAAGQTEGAVRTDLSPEDVAGWFISAWEGAVLRSKALRGPEPLLEFKRTAVTLFAD
ncbi:MAG: TetR/AcrR family transcriptional regulator [Neomegalonema sp.]|nr:TetR/AcrR family transcriptional regulator [Neomegalonema sp.]